jgi:hypothetical protein
MDGNYFDVATAYNVVALTDAVRTALHTAGFPSFNDLIRGFLTRVGIIPELLEDLRSIIILPSLLRSLDGPAILEQSFRLRHLLWAATGSTAYSASTYETVQVG